ncbi:MAG: DUF6465 family protein [Lachnospiraceae bacterium]|nr:DUF6465 family protein [Lachnospiraceae bacterium]
MAEEKKATAKVIAKVTPIAEAKKEEVKAAEPKKEVVKKAAPAKKAPAKKAAPAKKPAAAKAVAAKAVAAKAPAKKEAPKAAAPAKKAPAKKAAPAKKPAAAKAVATKAVVNFEFCGKSYTPDDLVNIAKDVWKYDLKGKAADFKSVELYVKPEESTAYYVINGDVTGSFFI